LRQSNYLLFLYLWPNYPFRSVFPSHHIFFLFSAFGTSIQCYHGILTSSDDEPEDWGTQEASPAAGGTLTCNDNGDGTPVCYKVRFGKFKKWFFSNKLLDLKFMWKCS